MSRVARSRMTMRAVIERDQATAKDAWNQPVPPNWAMHLSELPCFAWSRSRREVADGDKVALLKDFRMMIPLGTDVTEKDRVAEIKNRRGAVLFAGPFGIDAVEPRVTHLEVALQGVSS